MKKVKRLATMVIVLALAAIALGAWAVVATIRLQAAEAKIAQLTECDPSQAPEETEAPTAGPQPTPDTQPAEVSDDTAAAEFNGGIVTVAEAREEYGTIATYYFASGMTEDEFSDELKMTVLQTLTEERVMHAKAEALGLTELNDEQRAALEAQVTAEYEDNITYYSGFRYDESKTAEEIRSETIEYLNESGLSYESMLEQAEEGAWRDALREYAVKDTTIDDATLEAYYNVQVESDELTYSASFAEYEADANAGRVMAWNPEGVRRIETILIPFDEAQQTKYMNIQAELENGNVEHMDEIDLLYGEAEAAAAEVETKLKNGEDFAALQGAYSVLHPRGTFVSAESTACGDDFRDAAMALKNIGDISEPVRTDRGVAILRYAEDVPAGTVPLDDIREDLREAYLDQYRQEKYAETVDAWMAEANVKYYPERF